MDPWGHFMTQLLFVTSCDWWTGVGNLALIMSELIGEERLVLIGPGTCSVQILTGEGERYAHLCWSQFCSQIYLWVLSSRPHVAI